MSATSVLTRAEAVERHRLLKVRTAEIDLDLTKGSEFFGSTTVIRFSCAEAGAATFVDVKPARLHRVLLNGIELDVAALAAGRFPLTGLAAENELTVEADMAYSHTGEGMHRYTDPADGEDYLYTQSFLDDGPRVFASFDQPDLKAVHTLSVTAPARWTVVSNGIATRGEAGRWTFAPTPPISSYLVSLVAGPLHSVLTEHDGIPLGLHCRRSLAAHLDADAAELLEVTRQGFDHYHRVFRHRYPFDSYDQCFVPEFNAGAMENPGCVTLRDEYVFRSAVADTEREERAIVVTHEMAHMWFGDLVTMKWWDDLWLNESFAEYMAYTVTAESTRFTGAWTGFAAARKTWGYDADQRPSTHPVAPTAVEDTAQALQNFDGISYAKGASALRQLVAWLGEEQFLAGVNDYFEQHAFGNATLDDLLRSLAAASGRDVHGWAERWLRTTGVDTLRIEGGQVRHSAGDGRPRPHQVSVGRYLRTPDGALTLASREPLELAAAPAEVSVQDSDLTLLNDTDLSFVKVRLDERSWQTVRDSLGAVPEELARAVLWSSARDQVRDGELTPGQYLELVAAHLPGESSVHLVQAVLTFAGEFVVDRCLSPARRPWGLALLAGVHRALLSRTEGSADGSGLRLLAVRGLLATAATEAETAELRDWLAAGTVPGGPALDPDLRWRLLLRLCVLGAADEPEIAAELARDPSATSEEGAARCRAARPRRDAKEAAWAALFHGELSAYLANATTEGLWQPEQAELLDDLTLRYFEDVVATTAARGPAMASVLTRHGFPSFAATGATVRAAEACLAREDLIPATRRGVLDQLDNLRRAARARAVDGK
ncbi:aminopeptidase N [Kitasatospora sp. NBC_01287]|uniref:aminopeptidase N n=1 Tax=Kitasatospora sp. NBC_01287 TaxID=2903573 RepID=UPI0022535C14|nr:aminopeptidase N [Kitasatospora sp. NBC_01287]MCX4744474.1 aminopeptidase N [Kitasatospora sp. NBC_01287]